MDVTMTATLRPKVIERTLQSFHNCFLHEADDLRLIINIDLIGEDVDYREVLDIAGTFFNGNVLYRISEEPSFPAAFKWVWSQVESSFAFNLEDDWELLRPINLMRMMYLFGFHQDLAILRLPFSGSGIDQAKQWNKWFPWNGEFFECPADMRGGLGYSGHPSLIRTSWIRKVLPMLQTDRCPEKQIKWRTSRRMQQVLESHRYGVFQLPCEPPAVKDIGRIWREKRKLLKKGGVFGFTTWEENID